MPLREVRREDPAEREARRRGPLGVFSLRNAIVAVILAALAAGGAAAAAMKKPTVYSSQALLLIDQPSAVLPATDDGPLLKLSLLRVKYAELAGTSPIAGPAAREVGLSESQLVASTSVAIPPNSLLISTKGRAHTRTQAARLANALAHSLSTFVDNEQAALKVPVENRYEFNSIQPAAHAVRIEPSRRHALTTGLLLGGIVLVLAYVILQLLGGARRLD